MTGLTVWSSLTLQGSPELRDVLCCSQPYFINVDTEILVDENVTHSDDTRPRNLWARLAKRITEFPCRLNDNLDSSGNRILSH